MVRAGKAHSSEDIWHLSIDDLLAAPQEPVCLAGGGPFVINLSTSTARIGPPPKGMRTFDGLHVYQLRRGPDSRPRFLLRLGVIATEVEADAILADVREHYPGATKAVAEDDDRIAVAAEAHTAGRPKPAQLPPGKPPEAARPEPIVAAKPEEPIRWDVDELLPDLAVTRPSRRAREASPEAPPAALPAVVGALSQTPARTKSDALAARTRPSHEIEFAAPAPDEATPTRGAVEETDYDPDAVTQEVEVPMFVFEAPEIEAPAAPAASEPVAASDLDATGSVEMPAGIEDGPAPTFDDGSGTTGQWVASMEALVESADVRDEDEISPEDAAGDVCAPPPPAEPARPVSASAMARRAERRSPAPQAPAAEPAPAAAQLIDSTQTMRALTPLELADDQGSQWFSIQLSLSEDPIDPEHVPSLDIFNEYRLYSVTGLDGGRVMHALRLGFFSSELAADAVAGYLRGFFDSPCIKRVSLAERERFAEKGVTARKDIGATGLHAVIELTGPAPLPERHAQVSDSGKHRAPQSVWSRLVAPLKR